MLGLSNKEINGVSFQICMWNVWNVFAVYEIYQKCVKCQWNLWNVLVCEMLQSISQTNSAAYGRLALRRGKYVWNVWNVNKILEICVKSVECMRIVLKNTQKLSKTYKNGEQMVQTWSTNGPESPREPLNGPRWPPSTPRWSKMVPKELQHGPQTLPKWLKNASKMAPKWIPNAIILTYPFLPHFWPPLDLQNGPQMVPKWSKMCIQCIHHDAHIQPFAQAPFHA